MLIEIGRLALNERGNQRHEVGETVPLNKCSVTVQLTHDVSPRRCGFIIAAARLVSRATSSVSTLQCIQWVCIAISITWKVRASPTAQNTAQSSSCFLYAWSIVYHVLARLCIYHILHQHKSAYGRPLIQVVGMAATAVLATSFALDLMYLSISLLPQFPCWRSSRVSNSVSSSNSSLVVLSLSFSPHDLASLSSKSFFSCFFRLRHLAAA